jgi:hypothetical protein
MESKLFGDESPLNDNDSKLKNSEDDAPKEAGLLNDHNQEGYPRKSLSFNAPVVGTVSIGSSWERRFQTVALFSCSLYFILPMIPICWYWAIVCLINPLTTLPMACYLGFVFLFDKSSTTGSRRPFLRSLKWWWSHACDYFPISLVKTAH